MARALAEAGTDINAVNSVSPCSADRALPQVVLRRLARLAVVSTDLFPGRIQCFAHSC
jgi:hypothetical protein